LTTKTRYGARTLVHLARYHDHGPVPTAQIAAAQGLSAKYLEQVLSLLRAAGLVLSVRGAQGGYALARPASEITLREVFEALEGTVGLVECTTHPEQCARADECVMQQTWASLYAVCMEFLSTQTLADLARRTDERQTDQAPMYYV
jgi:Rrf2 family protein